jgi:hypothetical protein
VADRVDGLATQLRNRFGRERLVVRSAREICGDAAGTDSEGQDHNACGIHTLHFPQDAATLPPPWIGVDQLFVKAWLRRRI